MRVGRAQGRSGECRRLLVGVAFGLLLCGSWGWTAEGGAGRTGGFRRAEQYPRELLGAWRYVADDGTPGRKPAPEVITFGANGSYSVSGSGEPFNGRFRVDGEDVVVTWLVEGNTRSMRRGFKLDAKGLHFANEVQGSFAHYTRVRP